MTIAKLGLLAALSLSSLSLAGCAADANSPPGGDAEPTEDELVQKWELLRQGSVVGVWGSSANDVYFANPIGRVLHFDERASVPILGPFQEQTLYQAGSYAVALWGSSASNVYALDGGAGVWHSKGDGNWAAFGAFGKQTIAADVHGESIWGSGPNDIYVTAARYPNRSISVFHSTGNGAWVEQGHEIDNATWTDAVSGVWGSSSSDVYAATPRKMWHSTGTGVWQEVPALANVGTAMWGRSATDVYFGGAQIVHWNGAGAPTVEWAGDGSSHVEAIGGTTTLRAVGTGGLILRKTGNKWIRETSGVSGDLHGVWQVPGGGTYAVGHDGILFRK
ncbi:MAG: hypothetical protein JWP87_983 [Labilithrix sp.]|nr:hypothetical protein [Labilithrix sp.]